MASCRPVREAERRCGAGRSRLEARAHCAGYCDGRAQTLRSFQAACNVVGCVRRLDAQPALTSATTGAAKATESVNDARTHRGAARGPAARNTAIAST